jgi:hypothetical protein
MLPPCHSGRLARPDCDAIVLILPRSERSRNATSAILRICLCARTDCVSLRTGSEIDWILPLKGTPESCCVGHGSRPLARHDPPRVKYERLSFQAIVARLHKTVYQGSWVAACRSSKLDRGCAMGLQRGSFDVIERPEEPTGRCSLPESSMVTSSV